MKIAILSTEKKTLNPLYKAVADYSLKKLFVSRIEVFTDVNKFLNSSEDFDILFIDDSSRVQNVLNLIRQIRNEKPMLTIVLISDNRESVYDAFPLKVYRFILKPFSDIAITEALDSYRRDCLATRSIIVKVDKKYITYLLRDIYYIDADNRNGRINTRSETIQTGTYFPSIEEQLPSEFFFTCHRSISVNMMYVREFSAQQIILQNGVILPLSKRRKMDFFLAYNDFVKGHTV